MEPLNSPGRAKQFSSPLISNEISTATTTELDDFTERYHSWNDEDKDDSEKLLNSLAPAFAASERKDNCKIRLRLGSPSRLISLFSSDCILKFFAVIFYGILPYGFKKQTKKLHYSYLSLIFIALYWNSFFSYIYVVVTYWTSEDYGPRISRDTAIIILVQCASNTVTCTLVMHYFYRAKNNFSSNSKKSWSIIPRIEFNLIKALSDEAQIGPKGQDWVLANIFLLLGLCSVVLVASTDFTFNMFYGFYGIHDFVEKISWQKRIQYYIAVSTGFLACVATLLSCCILYVITRDLIRHIEYTENAILVRARNKDDFYYYHQCLHEYTNKMTDTCRHWFAIHNLFFITLVITLICEWFNLIKQEKAVNKVVLRDLLMTHISGSLMIAFTFAFPLISASRVTSKLSTFCFNLSIKCKIDGIPDLCVLLGSSGFKVYGIRISTSTAIVTFFSSFVGLFKVWSSFK